MNTTALHEAVSRMTPQLQGLALAISGDPMTADDLFQNAVERVLKTCTPETPNGIIYLRAKSAMLHTVRSENYQAAHTASPTAAPDDDGDEIEWEFCQPDQSSPEQEVIEREELAAIAAAVAKLSPEYRQVVRMLAIGMSQAEIAREMHVSRAAISIKVSRISTKLTSFGLQPA